MLPFGMTLNSATLFSVLSPSVYAAVIVVVPEALPVAIPSALISAALVLLELYVVEVDVAVLCFVVRHSSHQYTSFLMDSATFCGVRYS